MRADYDMILSNLGKLGLVQTVRSGCARGPEKQRQRRQETRSKKMTTKILTGIGAAMLSAAVFATDGSVTSQNVVG